MFQRIIIILGLCCFVNVIDYQPLLAQSISETRSSSAKNNSNVIPDEMVIKIHADTSLQEIHRLNEKHNSEIVEVLPSLALFRLKVTRPLEEALALYRSDQIIEYAKPNYIFAEIGGHYVTLMDVEFTIQNIIPALRQRYTKPQAKEKMLNFLVNDKLFSIAAKYDNLPNLPEVRRKIDAAVEKTLASEYRKSILTFTLYETELITDYNENKEKFLNPEQIKGRRILVETRQEAEEILEKLQAGAAFADLAKERSKDQTAKAGGGFGWLTRGQMVPEVEAVAFDLKKGETSGIIATKYGHYIIKVEDKKAAEQLAFSAVKNQIRQRLISQKRDEKLAQKTNELKEKYKVKLHPEFLSEIDVSATGATSQEDLLQILRKAFERPF